jgi:CBS domain containing-hemolysin-like protein
MLLVMLNGFFVATEFALVKVRATQLEPFAAQGTNGRRWPCIWRGISTRI